MNYMDLHTLTSIVQPRLDVVAYQGKAHIARSWDLEGLTITSADYDATLMMLETARAEDYDICKIILDRVSMHFGSPVISAHLNGVKADPTTCGVSILDTLLKKLSKNICLCTVKYRNIYVLGNRSCFAATPIDAVKLDTVKWESDKLTMSITDALVIAKKVLGNEA